MQFVNRQVELAALAKWWNQRGGAMALVWGRRRVGKTALLAQFAAGKRAIFHTGAGRPAQDELSVLSSRSAQILGPGIRELGARPFHDWDDAFETLDGAAKNEPLLLVLDEFPELTGTTPNLGSILRAFWDRAEHSSKLRILICGSALRTMRQLQEARAPLYGRFDLSIQLQPFTPGESAEILHRLGPVDRAKVWSIVGGVPLYLSWWDQKASLRRNLQDLFCTPGGRLLNEGRLVLATEAEEAGLGGRVLKAIAAGRTKYNQIAQAVNAEPSRTIERLIELRLVERLVPVTEDPRRSRKRIYRISDNFLAFWLGNIQRYLPEIELGLGPSIVSALGEELDDHIGPRWEDAFRSHLRRIALKGELGPQVVAVGSWWNRAGDTQIDAVGLAGRSRKICAAGEAKWTRSPDAFTIRRRLERKAEGLPNRSDSMRYVLGLREHPAKVPPDTLIVTAKEIFSAPD